jgi:hypothetical protein
VPQKSKRSKGHPAVRQAVTARPIADILRWPAAGITRVPLQVFAAPEVHAWAQNLISRVIDSARHDTLVVISILRCPCRS